MRGHSVIGGALFLFGYSLSALAAGRSGVGGVIDGGGTGGLQQFLNCSGQNASLAALSFEIRNTAAPNYIQGLLLETGADEGTSFACTKINRPVAPQGASTGTLLWKCDEIRARGGEGTQRFVAERNSLGIVTGTLVRSQAFPLEPQVAATFICTTESGVAHARKPTTRKIASGNELSSKIDPTVSEILHSSKSLKNELIIDDALSLMNEGRKMLIAKGWRIEATGSLTIGTPALYLIGQRVVFKEGGEIVLVSYASKNGKAAVQVISVSAEGEVKVNEVNPLP